MKKESYMIVAFVVIMFSQFGQNHALRKLQKVSEDKTGSYHMVYVVYKYHWEPVYSARTESECKAWFKHWIQSIDNVGAAVITKNAYGEYLGGEAGMNIVSSLFGEE